MMAPCEYCGRWCDAETFMRVGVPPCCRDCGRYVLTPIVLALTLMAVGLVAWVVYAAAGGQ